MMRRRFIAVALTAPLLLAAPSHTFAENAGKKPLLLSVLVQIDQVQVEVRVSKEGTRTTTTTKNISQTRLAPVNGGHIRNSFRADQTDIPLWRFLGPTQNDAIKHKRASEQLRIESRVYYDGADTVALDDLTLTFSNVIKRSDGGWEAFDESVRGGRIVPFGKPFVLFGATESTDARVVKAVEEGKTPDVSGINYTAYFLSVTVNHTATANNDLSKATFASR